MMIMQAIPLFSDRPTVLVAEDEAFIREMLVDALEEAGFEVVAVAAAEDALGFAVMDFAFDALVTDIGLDGPLDGWDLAATTREMRPDLPVVYASASAAADRATRGVAGAVFVPKPYNPVKLAETLAGLVAARRAAQASTAGERANRPPLRLIA